MDTALGKRLKREEDLLKLGRRLCAKYRQLYGAMQEWRTKRDKFKKYSEGNYEDRRTRDETSIYSKSNHALEFITGVTDFMVARTSEDVLGSEPFFAAIPQGRADEALSDQITKHFGFKLREADFVPLARQLIHRAYHLGEGIAKATWRRTEDVSEKLAMVLCSKESGKPDPVIDENGEYIYPDDFNLMVMESGLSLWAKSPIVVPEEGWQFVQHPDIHPLPVLVDDTNTPVLSPGNEYWFESDIQIVLDEREEQELGKFLCKSPIVKELEGWSWEEMLVEDRHVTFEGLDISLVAHGDFVAPMNVPTLCDANVFHRLSLPLSVLKSDFGLDKKTEEAIGRADQSPKSDEKRAQSGEGEVVAEVVDEECEDPEYECIECYGSVMVPGLDQKIRIYALVEAKTERVIICDYLANVVPGAQIPFSIVRACPVTGRWHGRGYHEIYELQNDFIDRTFNAIAQRNKMHANPTGFFRAEAFDDASVQKNFVYKIGQFYRLKRDFTPNDALGFVETPDLDSRTWQIMELVMQMAQVRSGVTGASQGAVTNLPANGTATGVQSIMMSGSTLHKLPIDWIKGGLEKLLCLCASILYSRQNRDETFTYMEGDAMELITLHARNVKDLKLNIRILLTRLHEREAMENARAAIDAIMLYLREIPEEEKDQVRPLFIQVLKALKISGADGMVRRGLPPPPDAKPPQQERFTESLNYKDVPEDIKRQMEAAAGYQPSQLPPPTKEQGKKGEEDPIRQEEGQLPVNAS